MKVNFLMFLIAIPSLLMGQINQIEAARRLGGIVEIYDQTYKFEDMYFVFNISFSHNSSTDGWNFDKNVVRIQIVNSENLIYITDISGKTLKSLNINKKCSLFYPSQKISNSMVYYDKEKIGRRWDTVDNNGLLYRFDYVGNIMTVAYYTDNTKSNFVRTYYVSAEYLPR